ncbi:hypothetical protein [Paenibacillus taiwanensis]|uniref:hypothetical protein n=1 Tax=Paenibacillus taiwanensis TaxID=401638 RepID=UPI00048F2184|nr:hypothetical protein [Paenibacillus taiwanensis]
MVDRWPKDTEFSDKMIEKLNETYLSWGRYMPDESSDYVERRKEEVYEKAKLSLEERGRNIADLIIEFDICHFSANIDPLDFSFLVGLKEVETTDG